jgi:hypothetical protein
MNNLNYKIKKTLIEIKTIKDNQEVGKKIFNSRVNFIVESNLKSLNPKSIKNQIKTFILVLEEINSSEEYGFIVEQDGLDSLLKGLFGDAFDGIATSIVEPLTKSILTKIGITGSMLDTATSHFLNDKSKLVEAFKSCDSMAHVISQIIENSMVDDIRKNTSPDGMGNSFIKNHLIDTIQSNDNFLISLKDKIKPIVCDIYNRYISRAKRIESALKEPMV